MVKKKFKNSSWTDIPAFVVFLIFLSALFYICIHSFLTGTKERIINPVDSLGVICGSKKQSIIYDAKSALDKRYLFTMGFLPFYSRTICVQHCPNINLNSATEIFKWIKIKHSQLCDPIVMETNYTLKMNFDYTIPFYKSSEQKYFFTSVGPCPSLPVFATIAYGRYCIPYVNNFTRVTQLHVNSMENELHNRYVDNIDMDNNINNNPIMNEVFNPTPKSPNFLIQLKWLTVDLLHNKWALLIIPCLVFVLLHVFLGLLKRTGPNHECLLWFMTAFALPVIYIFGVYSIWTLACQHALILKSITLGLATHQDKINFYILCFLVMLVLATSLFVTISFVQMFPQFREAFMLIGACKIYLGALSYVWVFSSAMFILQMLCYYVLLILVPANLLTSDIPSISSSTGFITFHFAYRILYILSTMYCYLMILIILPAINLNMQALVYSQCVSQFYFDRKLVQKQISLPSLFMISLRNVRHLGSIIVLTIIQAVFWLPRLTVAFFTRNYLEDTRSLFINAIQNQPAINFFRLNSVIDDFSNLIKSIYYNDSDTSFKRNRKEEKTADPIIMHNIKNDDGSNNVMAKNDESILVKNIFVKMYIRYFLIYPLRTPLISIAHQKCGYFKAVKNSLATYLSSPLPVEGISRTVTVVFWFIRIGMVSLAGILSLISYQLHPESRLFGATAFICCFGLVRFAANSVLLSIETTVNTILYCVCEDLRLSVTTNGLDDNNIKVYSTPLNLLEFLKKVNFVRESAKNNSGDKKPHDKKSKDDL